MMVCFSNRKIYRNSKQNDVNNATEAFYAFDFGVTDNEPQSANHSKNNSISSLSTTSHLRSDSSSSESGAAVYSSDDEEGAPGAMPTNGDSLVLSPPKKQARAPKKSRRGSNSVENGKSENERAFESLHKRFDPSLIGTTPVNQIHTKTEQQKQLKAAQKGKRHTEPTNIHSERLAQLKEEGLVGAYKVDMNVDNTRRSYIVAPAPQIGGASRTKSTKNKKRESEQKEESKPTAKAGQKMNYNVLPEMHRGTALLKYGRRGYPHFRQFNLTDDNERMLMMTFMQPICVSIYIEHSVIHICCCLCISVSESIRFQDVWYCF